MKVARMWMVLLCGLPLLLAPAAGGQSEADAAVRVLVFSKTAGFRHSSIPAGIAAIEALGSSYGFQVDATEESEVFTAANLAQYEAVIFLMTSGDILNGAQQAAFEGYIQGGGGYVGIHSASDTEYDWPWYGQLIGAYFESHPHIQTATINVEETTHPSTAHLPASWMREDEWYNFQTNPRGMVNVLLSLDETSYEGGTMGDHPLAWYHEFDGGRAWYTGGGHTAASYSEPAFVQHLLGGIQYAVQTPLIPVAYDEFVYLPLVLTDEAAADPPKRDPPKRLSYLFQYLAKLWD